MNQKQFEPAVVLPTDRLASLDSNTGTPRQSVSGISYRARPLSVSAGSQQHDNPCAGTIATNGAALPRGLPEIFVDVRSLLSTNVVTFLGIHKISQLCDQFQIKLIPTEQTDVFFVSGVHSALIALEQHLRHMVSVHSSSKAYNAVFVSELSVGSVARMPPPGLKKSGQTTQCDRSLPQYHYQRASAPELRNEQGESKVTGKATRLSFPTSGKFHCDMVTFNVTALTAGERLRQLEEECKVSIETSPSPDSDDGTLQVVVTGNSFDSRISEGLEQLKRIFSDVQERIVTSKVQISKAVVPAVGKVNWNGLKTLMRLESNVCILVGLKEDVAVAVKTLQQVLRSLSPIFGGDASSEAFILETGHTVIVKKGDITREKVDVIVNAANGQLKHFGGIAKAICQAAGGTSFQVESSELIRKRGPVNEGEAVATGAGSLKCKIVVHAVVPQWSVMESKQSHCLTLLRKLCYNCLQLTDERGCMSVAIPGLGSGNSGIPRLSCAKALIAGTEEFFRDRPTSCIRPVIFIDMDESTVGAFRSQARKTYGPCVVSLEMQTQANVRGGTPLRESRV